MKASHYTQDNVCLPRIQSSILQSVQSRVVLSFFLQSLQSNVGCQCFGVFWGMSTGIYCHLCFESPCLTIHEYTRILMIHFSKKKNLPPPSPPPHTHILAHTYTIPPPYSPSTPPPLLPDVVFLFFSHWGELPQVYFLLRKHVFCRDKSMLVMTKLLSWKGIFVVATTHVCRDKNYTCGSPCQWYWLVDRVLKSKNCLTHLFASQTEDEICVIIRYTSLGSMNNTHPNPSLQIIDQNGIVSYKPAYELVENGNERDGRNVWSRCSVHAYTVTAFQSMSI